ncbi:MAG TPA: FAD-dependent 5-carboxymethylaminomethyl-2-thiouridine(34) oxidoreductase MnmC [Ideonella sp.]|nr:FAD-dependent 5-carboxymethylaminomethyl-2-thiouridine(34) oxidoreductase MnmC [Ideonella sp.]
MKTQAIVPAEIVFDHPQRPGQPFATHYGDVYRPRDGEFGQARHVFLAGNGLPGRWQGRPRFAILETGFGLGHNFLATWQAWRADPARCERLYFVSVEKHPPRREALAQAHAASPAPELAAALLAAWPPLTHDLHTLSFEQGRVTLLLALGDVATWLPELVAGIDAVYLDGFSPARNAQMWDRRVFKACARLAAEGATAATWSVARSVHEGLAAAGFAVERAPGFGGKREMTLARLRALPRHAAPPGRRAAPACQTALVIGAGLAGASAADALARQGLRVTVLERHAAAAQETSGNVAGLFHGVLHPQDGAHAQLLRAAALRAAQVYRRLIESGRVAGAIDGLLRGAPDELATGTMLTMLAQQGLPADYVQALDAAAASAQAACPVAGPAWLYTAGGWLSPGPLVQAWLATEGVTLQPGAEVASLRRDAQTRAWQALDHGGRLLAEADLVVVASAAQAPVLLAPHTDAATWPLQSSRGQITQVPDAPAQALHLPRPRLPLASGGYLIALPPALGGGVLCGATSQPGDTEPALRDADHAANFAQITKLTGLPVASLLEALGDRQHLLRGRVGWRLASDDRLPVVGPVTAPLAGAGPLAGAVARLEQPRQVPRVEGLYVFTALGSRGITLAPLLAQTLAAWITGAPLPLGAGLIDAIDPARFVSRRLRQAARHGAASAPPHDLG